MTAALPTVSIIINTLNRATHLEDSLRAIAALDYPAFEVVVVDGPSTDGTGQLLTRWSDRIKVGQCGEANLSASRNVGLSLAAGEIVCFIDDDAAPHPQWLRRLAERFHDPRVGGAGGFTIDNTGVRYQVRKTLCDRFGNAFNVSPRFDERALCRPGTPYYPSLLGTNSAFRASALRAIGGFDPAFAYLLDETDVCLRLVDAGWQVCYEPAALVFHRFAASHIRSTGRVARTLYPSAVSKGYFIMRHGARQSFTEAGAQLQSWKDEILASNAWMEATGEIDETHRFSLDQDLVRGLDRGIALARNAPSGGALKAGTAPAFKAMPKTRGLRIALVSRGYPPRVEAGIARWTALAAEGLAGRGHQVHVITEASGEGDTSVEFKDGRWLHRIHPAHDAAGAVGEAYGLPPGLSAWAAAVLREIQGLKSFGLDVASFPIWDLEGVALLDEPGVATVVSLHTTYAMAKPFKPEWSLRPLFEHTVVSPVIAGEKAVLARAPMLLANSEAVQDAIRKLYGVNVRKRALLVPHGVPDPLIERAEAAARREAAVAAGATLRVLFVGRFEDRKGFEIAAAVAAEMLCRTDAVDFRFAGDTLTRDHRAALISRGLGVVIEDPSIRFLGPLDRAAVDDAYVDADLVLFPSRFESFGLVAIEAMAARRPVLALAEGAVAEVVTAGAGGLTWPYGPDVAGRMADEIVRLNRDREALLAMGRQARAAFEARYTLEIMAEGLERAYRAAATGARP